MPFLIPAAAALGLGGGFVIGGGVSAVSRIVTILMILAIVYYALKFKGML